jgi:hypothetical protein
VDVHRAARLAGDRLGHEGGEHVVAHRRFSERALEEEDLVGELQRVVVEEVDLHLASADLVDQRVHVQLHLLAVGVDILEQRVELVHGVDRIRLARGLGAPAAADRGLQRHVGVGVAGDEVELQLGGHDRVPALGIEQVADPAQHRTRRERHHLAVLVVAVVDDLRGRVGRPRHDAHGGRVGAQVHVAVGGVDHVVVRAFFGEFPRHAHGDHRLGQPHAAVLGEFLAGQDLAARHARQVGDEAFDLGDAALVEPVFEVAEGEVLAGVHGGVPGSSRGADRNGHAPPERLGVRVPVPPVVGTAQRLGGRCRSR